MDRIEAVAGAKRRKHGNEDDDGRGHVHDTLTRTIATTRKTAMSGLAVIDSTHATTACGTC
jgi:hypothetical protein